jgi:hypothetical protein
MLAYIMGLLPYAGAGIVGGLTGALMWMRRKR